MLITGVAALSFTAGPQQDLPPAFGTRSILLQRVDRSDSENNATYNASWRGGPAAAVAGAATAAGGAAVAGGARATGGAAAATGDTAAAAVKSWGPGWAPSPAPPSSGGSGGGGGGGGGRASSVPSPPAAPPATIDISSPAAQDVFAVASGVLGLLFALLVSSP